MAGATGGGRGSPPDRASKSAGRATRSGGSARAAILVFAALFLGTCREAAVTEVELLEAEASWRGHGITSYDIDVVVTGGPERRVHVAVHDGAIAEATVMEHSMVRSLNEAQASPYTVEGLFRTLAEELRGGERQFVRVWFDARYGFPEHMELGPRRGRPEAGVLLLRVERFEATSSPRGSLPVEQIVLASPPSRR